MSYEFVQGNLFDSDAVLKVITVNCVGVMGKGLALECKQRYPWVFQEYRRLCQQGQVTPGSVHLVSNGIVLVATKDHWRDDSYLPWIANILNGLSTMCMWKDVPRIAIPPLGAGLGNLQWKHVRPLITSKFADHPTHALIYGGAP